MTNILEKIQLSNELYQSKMMTNKSSIASTTNDILFSCFSEGTDKDNFRIKVMRSEDNGVTWKDTNFPNIGETDQIDPCMIIDTGNTIHVVFVSRMSKGEGTLRIYYSQSINGGKSWTEPRVLQPLVGYDQCSPNMLFDKKNNTLHICWVGTDNKYNKKQIKHCSSIDGGTSWSFYKNVQPIANYDQECPVLAVDNQGSVYVFWHGNDEKNTEIKKIKYSKSIDNGGSWAKWKNINDKDNDDQMHPDVDIDSKNNIYVAYDSSSNKDIRQIKLITSKSYGASWETTEQLTYDNYNQTNPLVLCHDKYVNVIWKSCNHTSINPRIKYCRSTDGKNFNDPFFVTPIYDNTNNFSIFKFKDYLLLSYETFYSVLIKKLGYRKILIQDKLNLKQSIIKESKKCSKELELDDSRTICLDTRINPKDLKLKKIVYKEVKIGKEMISAHDGTITLTPEVKLPLKIKFTKKQDSKETELIVNPEKDTKTYKLNVELKEDAPVTAKSITETDLLLKDFVILDYSSGKIFINIEKEKIEKDTFIKADYTSITREWKTIGTVPVTVEKFDQYGHDELNWLDFNEYKKLESNESRIVFNDKGMEYTRPAISIRGDMLSRYNYKVEMENQMLPLKRCSEYVVGETKDQVLIPSNMIKDSDPQNIFITVKQKYNDIITKRRGSIVLRNEAPLILANINGTRLDMQINDPDNDEIKFKIELNGKKVYPEGKEYTSLLKSPHKFTYIFQTEQIKVDENNVIIITAKDKYDKKSIVRLDFTGVYVGLIFVDEDDNRFSTDSGNPLKILNMGTIQSGTESDVYKIYLDNKNGFDIKNIKVWSSDKINNGKLKFSKTAYPFKEEDSLLFEDVLKNGDKKEFFVKIQSSESATPGGGDFRIFTNAEIDVKEKTPLMEVMPQPDPSSTVKFIVKNSEEFLSNALIKFNGINYKTDKNGIAEFKHVPVKDNIDYTIFLNGYVKKTGKVNVQKSNELIEQKIDLEKIKTNKVKFTIKDKLNKQPVINCKLIFNEQKIKVDETEFTLPHTTLNTLFDGTAEIELPKGTFSYTINDNRFEAVKENNLVISDEPKNIELQLENMFIATVKINGEKDPIEYANLTLNEQVYKSDYNGIVKLKLKAGQYKYKVNVDKYNEFNGTLNIKDAPIENVVTMVKTV